MNQRPFISTQLNIFDENRCVFSPSMIAGQPVMISQEQNRKICDSMTTAIASNQLCNNSCFYGSPPPAAYCNQPQIWSCPLQAQKQGVPGGVVFNFSQPNYCCPQSCHPSIYNPPPPPCPQVIDCCHKTPQSICVDFGKYGMEAMAFQQKCRQQCQGFTYDKQVGTGDQILFQKCNTCCCGVQSVTLNADQKEQLFHRIDECDTRSKLRICACDPVETRRCTCFPKPNPNKYGSAKNLVIGERKEKCCRDYDIVDQATREADAEAYLCCDCLDRWKKKNETRRPSCLKKKCECSDEKRDELSFSFCGKTLEITEERKTTLKSLKQPTNQLEIEDIASTKRSSQNDNADVVKYINEMKIKRKGIVKMAHDFRTTAKDYINQLDRDIDHFRELYKVANVKKNGKESYIDTYNLNYLFDNSEFEKTEQQTDGKYTNSKISKRTPKMNVPNYQKKKDQYKRQINAEEKIIKVIPPIPEKNKFHRANEGKTTIIESEVKSPGFQQIHNETTNDKSESNTDSNDHSSDQIDRSVTNEKTQNVTGTDEKTINEKKEINVPENSQKPVSKVKPDEEPAPTTPISESNIPVIPAMAESSKPKPEFVSKTETKKSVNVEIIKKGSSNVPAEELKVQEDGSAHGKDVRKPDGLASKKFGIEEKTTKPDEQICNEICIEKKKDDKTERISIFSEAATDPVNNNQLNKSSNDEMIQVGQKSNKVQTSPELDSDSKFIQTNVASTSKAQQSLDNVSFSDQVTIPENAKDGVEIEKTNKTDDQSTPAPQASDDTITEKALEKTCPGKKYCMIINHNTAEERETKAIQAKILCNCCDCKVGDDNIEETCCRGASPLITVGKLISSICSSAIDTTGRILNYIIPLPQLYPCRSTQPFYENPCVVMNRCGCNSGCYDTRMRRYLPELDRPRYNCSCSMSTNRFCGKTCYDYGANNWYSCCDGFCDNQKVVRVTFKDTAEKRTIRLENNCRNSRYHVVYE